MIKMIKNTVENLITRSQNRKFQLTILFFLTATLLVVASPESKQWLTGEQWKNMAEWLFAVYVGGNVGQKVLTPKEGIENE